MTSRINPIAPRLWWDVLNPSELERIHEATLDVLETVGIRFPSERALDILEKNGCEVVRATQVAKLPRAVVMEAVSQVPDSYVLAGRDLSGDGVAGGDRPDIVDNSILGRTFRDPDEIVPRAAFSSASCSYGNGACG